MFLNTLFIITHFHGRYGYSGLEQFHLLICFFTFKSQYMCKDYFSVSIKLVPKSPLWLPPPVYNLFAGLLPKILCSLLTASLKGSNQLRDACEQRIRLSVAGAGMWYTGSCRKGDLVVFIILGVIVYVLWKPLRLLLEPARHTHPPNTLLPFH